MRRGLCIGYSVTEGRGFIEKVNELALADGCPLILDRSGWGGHSIDTIGYMIDRILDGVAFDFVILEISTTGRHLGPQNFCFYLEQVLCALAVSNVPIMFLNLFDRNVDYANDFLTKLIDDYTHEWSIPVLDLIREVAKLPPVDIDLLLSDNVHTYRAGAEFYGIRLYDFLQKVQPSSRYATKFCRISRVLFNFCVFDLLKQKSSNTFRRNGTALNFVELPEGEQLTIPIPHPIALRAVMMIYGPRSGRVRLRSSHSYKYVDVLPYDSFSYYERSGFMVANLMVEDEIKVFQSGLIPAIALRKGEPNFQPRVGRISHLMYRLDQCDE